MNGPLSGLVSDRGDELDMMRHTYRVHLFEKICYSSFINKGAPLNVIEVSFLVADECFDRECAVVSEVKQYEDDRIF
jgi:hypothetical protein